jgi:KaiC/GvpD/RAD55 family RecA-like ATPase
MQKLSPNFMAELFKLMFIDLEVMRIASGHLEYSLIPKEWSGYKFLFREALEQFNKREAVPSLGAASQKFANNEIVQDTIDEIKNANIVDKELIIDQLESFIKETQFELLSKKVHDLYEEGKKEEAIRVNSEESKSILELSLRKTGGNFVRVFGGFEERMKKKRSDELNKPELRKVQFGIDKLDELTYGGMEPGDTALWILRSGDGKSTALRWHGFCAALNGEPVLHIQLEGGRDACVDKYDQIWTAQSYMDIKQGNINEKDKAQILKTCKDMENFGQDISVYGFARFGESSMNDVRNLCFEYHKIYGYFPRLVILDSLDLVASGTNKKMDEDPTFIKYKLQRSAQLFKDLMVEINAAGITATQASNVPIEIWNNEDKVIDRSYTEGDKTLVKPFSFVFTGNRTILEKKEDRLRVYIDKFRDYRDSQTVFTVATDYDRGRFYHRGRTMELYYDRTNSVQTEEKKERLGKAKRSKAQTI